jgi:hypothetical protein
MSCLAGRRLVLFLGNGPRYQYQDVAAITQALRPHIEEVTAQVGDWVAVFGGDSYVPEAPDLGAVMKSVKDTFGIPLCAVVGWEDVDEHVDITVKYEIQKDERTGRDLYGGFGSDGKPVGGSAVYLSPEWLDQMDAVISVAPIGSVGASELQYVKDSGVVPIRHVHAAPRFPPAPATAAGQGPEPGL